MKKYLKVFMLLPLCSLGLQATIARADTTSQSSSSTTVSSSSTRASTQSSSSSSTQSTQESSQGTQTNASDSAGQNTVTSTTEQPPADQNPAGKSQDSSKKTTDGSTTIIKETVTNNNNTKGNNSNLWTIILTSLSALVTISGGLIAALRHFRNLRKKKELDQSGQSDRTGANQTNQQPSDVAQTKGSTQATKKNAGKSEWSRRRRQKK